MSDRIDMNAKKGEANSMACAIAQVVLTQMRDRNNQIGRPLSESQQTNLKENCGHIDFEKWVDDEKARAQSHRGIDAMKSKRP